MVKRKEELQGTLEQQVKKDSKKEIIPIEPFVFQRSTLDELTPVYEEPDRGKQLRTINKRCKAMFDYCLKYDLVMTNAHIALVLGVNKDTLARWIEGKQSGYLKHEWGKKIAPDIESLQFVKDRALMLRKWLTMAEMRSCDKISRDKNPTGAVYLTKATFGLQDNPKGAELSPGIHVENLILRAEQLKKAALVQADTDIPSAVAK